MDDLNGLDWTSSPDPASKPGYYSSLNSASLKPTPHPPTSRSISPAVPSNGPPRPSTGTSKPADDSFANLTPFSTVNNSRNVSLEERQKQLGQSRLDQLVANKKNLQNAWANDEDAWSTLANSGSSTPALRHASGARSPPVGTEEEDDLFAEFNRGAPIARSSGVVQPKKMSAAQDFVDDDDPFDLVGAQSRQATRTNRSGSRPQLDQQPTEDDILGDLNRPVMTRAKVMGRSPSPTSPRPTSGHPQDRAVAELVDMGFSADKARAALQETETGMNVQAAVGILLNQAHEEARQKSRSRSQQPQSGEDEIPQRREQQSRRQNPQAEAEPGSWQTPERSRTPLDDPAKAAQELGAKFMKSAGSFFQKAQRQAQQLVQDLNSDSDTGSDASQPKWARADHQQSQGRMQERRRRRSSVDGRNAGSGQGLQVTDEAAMLEMERPGSVPPPRPSRPIGKHRQEVVDLNADVSRDHSPAVPSRLRQAHSTQPDDGPSWMKQKAQRSDSKPEDPMRDMLRPRQPPSGQPRDPRAILSKQVAEEEAGQAYVSSARRRKLPVSEPKPESKQTELEGDLLDGTFSVTQPQIQQSTTQARSTQSKVSTQTPSRKPATQIHTPPSAPVRSLPPIPPLSLRASNQSRFAGNAAFKLGDYGTAHTHYTTALSHLPAQHTLTLPILTNHALTSLKTGQPKAAITSTDKALNLMGPSKGDNEIVVVSDESGAETEKQMKEYYSKALIRKAEALEALERWRDAADIWRQAVEDGVGGPIAVQGRQRCESHSTPKSGLAATRDESRQPPRKPGMSVKTPLSRSVASTKPATAVNALRAANREAERLDDEKFRLADSVAAKINTWKSGKEDNLRGLLASLDTVLWEGSGWTKVGMGQLVIANKVKVVYMKGIAKCHPDKIPTDATTEQRMIAGAVFSTLNEAWDKFRVENNL